MARKSSANTPTVVSGRLYTNDVNTTGIKVDSAEWSGWLEDASTFYFESGSDGFTVRKYHHRRGYFWYAFKRVNKRLYKRYVGTRENLDLDRLHQIAAVFADVRRGGGN